MRWYQSIIIDILSYTERIMYIINNSSGMLRDGDVDIIKHDLLSINYLGRYVLKESMTDQEIDYAVRQQQKHLNQKERG